MAMQLGKGPEAVQRSIKMERMYSRRTPTLYNGRKQCLLRVVCNVGPYTVQDSPVLPIAAQNDLGALHVGFQGGKYASNRGVEQLPTKLAELHVVIVLPRR